MLRILASTACLSLPLMGCASNAIEVSVQTRSHGYRILEHPQKVLASNPPNCAVLPANAGGTPGFGGFMNAAMERVLREEGLDSSVIAPTETGNLMTEAGKVGLLDELMNSWSPSNVLDPALLREVGEALEVRFLLAPYLVSYSTSNNPRFSFFGVTAVRTGWTTVQVLLQLWHAPTGVMVWQSEGIATLACEGIVGPPVPIGPTIAEAARPMLQDFMAGRSESIISTKLPAPKPSAMEAGPEDSAPDDSTTPPAPAAAVDPMTSEAATDSSGASRGDSRSTGR